MGTSQVKVPELQSLLERHLPQPYRYYRDFVPQRALQTLAKARVRRLVERVGTEVVLVEEMGRVLGAGGWSTLPLYSEQFGFGAGLIEFLVSDGNYRESCRIKTLLLGRIVDASRSRGVRHVTAHVQPSDLSTIHT